MPSVLARAHVVGLGHSSAEPPKAVATHHTQGRESRAGTPSVIEPGV